MKSIILAAGMGTRLKKYTQSLPKGMLNFMGRPLIQWQIEAYRRQGIEEIVIVTGHCAHTIAFEGVHIRHNPHFSTTNMVSSLLCARDLLQDDILISYADLILADEVIKKARDFKGDMGVVVDMNWIEYWQARYGRHDFDTESLMINSEGEISSLGKQNAGQEEMDGRYVGLLKFSAKGMSDFIEAYDQIKILSPQGPWRHSKDFSNAYMTDMLQELIDRGKKVKAIPVNNGWLEFDSDTDYEKCLQWYQDKSISRFIEIPS